MLLLSVLNGRVGMRRMLRLPRCGMAEASQEVEDVVPHGQSAGAFGVVPIEVDADVEVTVPIFGDIIMLFEGIAEVIRVPLPDVLDAKVVDN